MDAQCKSTHVNHQVKILREFLFFDIFESVQVGLALIQIKTKADGQSVPVQVPRRVELVISTFVQVIYWPGGRMKKWEGRYRREANRRCDNEHCIS